MMYFSNKLFLITISHFEFVFQGPRTQQRNLPRPPLPRVLPTSRGLQGLLRQLPSALRTAVLRPNGRSEIL